MCLPQITKLLMIGWRASEVPFLDLLASNLQRAVRVMAVSGGKDGARKVLDKLARAGITGEFVAFDGGFTDFTKRGADDFLRN